MKKYNYYDDEPEELGTKTKRKPMVFNFKNVAKEVKQTADDIVHGDALAELNEMPLLKKRITKIFVAILIFLILFIFIFSVSYSIASHNKANESFCEDAGKVCTEYIKEFGSVKWEALDETIYGENKARLTGLCYVRRMDFDNDGSDELMLCYNNKNVYYLEVWGYSHKKFTQLYSQEANSTENDTDGVWVGFYHKNNKYYICKSEKNTANIVTLYALHGDKFKAELNNWDYDYENRVYSKKGKDNTQDFETIELSVFRKSKAEIIVNTVTKNIDDFGNISSKAITNSKSKSQLENDAYYDVVKRRIEKYGIPKIENGDGYSFIDGVAMVRLIDFDGDSSDELMIVYRKYKSKSKYDNYSGQYIYYDVPMYGIDIYKFNGTDARRIFSKETVSNCLESENENVFYLMLKGGKKTISVCNNVYTFENSYNYTASSKIYSLKDERFETVYNSKLVNEYGYKQYYIDGDRVYSSEFEESGKKVPMFLNDDDVVSDSSYTVTYLSGREEETYQKTIKETNDVIKKLNPDYSSVEITQAK
ncbi:MAG: hypothetical protein ACI4V4_01030 [Eubacterium sp.]